jgi:hypothetical protein
LLALDHWNANTNTATDTKLSRQPSTSKFDLPQHRLDHRFVAAAGQISAGSVGDAARAHPRQVHTANPHMELRFPDQPTVTHEDRLRWLARPDSSSSLVQCRSWVMEFWGNVRRPQLELHGGHRILTEQDHTDRYGSAD